MLKKIKSLFKKKTFSCIVWDGKSMKYLNLTQKEIDEINTNPKYKNWSVTLHDD
ncbi:hypothetical protein AHALO_1547 [Malaciobacter halophilus]|uniref:hypothetical protein n=1 Tax=Malaciobacter halophilus TaxID=197482 RepID=UPI000E1070AB|nr:hypothetical protein [Malaciobacter halophilus]AXH09915.1 hypothetical protein AHALO_1547 [Malaciobacter halophilus]